MEYKLSVFGLNKQSLKRKLPKIVDEKLRASIENILNDRTTYDIKTIEYIVDSFYSNKVERQLSDKPLGIYYSNLNKEKFDNLKSLIEIKKTGSISISLEKDIKKLIRKSNEELISEEKYKQELENIAEKYGIMMSEVYRILYKVENEWLSCIE